MAKQLTTEDLVLNIIVNSNKAQSEIGKVSRELQDAKSKASAAQAELKKLEKAGKTSTTRYKQLQDETKKYNATITESRTRLDQLNQSMSLEDKTIKQLNTSLRKLKSLRDQSAPNSAQYKEYEQQLSIVTNRLNELKYGADQTGKSLINMSGGLNRYVSGAVAGVASFVAVASGINKATQDYAAFDDVLADVMKTTDLAKESVKELNVELEQIDTRTSQEDLLGLGRIAGKLGYKDISEITDFVRANNQIIVALNEDLGGNVEETVNKIGKLVDIFKLRDLYSTEEAFLKVGSAINELGMASTANEGYMVEFTRRMAGIAPLAGISIDQILGLGAALDQLGQTEEVSSTALSKLFLALAKDAATYAKYAGMEVNKFKDLLEKDFMGAFTKVLQGVRNNSEGINELAATLGDLGQDGGRVIGVIGSLANNVDLLTGSMELSNKALIEGTSITDEYNIKNETAAAVLDRKRKEVNKLWRELGEKLWPAYAEGQSLFMSFLSMLGKTITFVAENISVISKLAIVITVYYTTLQVAAKWEAITKAVMAAKKVTIVGLNGVYALLTGRITRATAAQRLLNIIMAANPYAIATSLIATLVIGLISYNENLRGIVKTHDSLEKAKQAALDQTAGETKQIADLNKVMLDNKASMDDRLTAMEQIKKIMPAILDGYTKEELLAGSATDAINKYTEALILNAEIKAKQDRISELTEQGLKVERKEVGFVTEAYRTLRGLILVNPLAADAANALDDAESLLNINNARKELTQSIIEDQQKLNKLTAPKGSDPVISSDKNAVISSGDKAKKSKSKNNLDSEKQYWEDLAAAQEEGHNKELHNLDKRYAELNKLTGLSEKERTRITEIYQAQRSKILLDIEKKNSKEYREQLKADWETTYRDALQDQEQYYLDRLEQINNSEAKESEKQIARAQLEEEQRIRLQELDQEKLNTRMITLAALSELGDLEVEEEKRIADEIAAIKKQQVDAAIAEAKREQDQRLAIERETNDALEEIKMQTVKAYEAAFGFMGDVFRENSELANVFLILEKAAAAAYVITNLQKEIAGYYAAAALQSALNPFATAIAAKQATAAKIRAGISLATIAGTVISGISANSKRSKESTEVSGRESGGYFDVTRSQDGKRFRSRFAPNKRGFVDQPTVLVGENGREWVASAQAVNNPTVKPVIDIIEMAQRNGSIDTLNLQNIIAGTRQIRTVSGRESGGFVGNSSTETFTDPELLQMLDRLNKTVRKLEVRLSNLKVTMSMLGKGGFVEHMDELTELEEDANL